MMDFNEIKKRAQQVYSEYSAVDKRRKEVADAYWMNVGKDVMKHKDIASVKTVISPTPANMVDGGIRLMTAVAPIFNLTMAEDQVGDAGKCEALVNKVLTISNQQKRSPIQVEAARSALLYSDVHIRIKSLADMLTAKNLLPGRKSRLERLAKLTPYLIEVIRPGYPILDNDLALIAYLRIREMMGDVAKSEYGGEDWLPTKQYKVWDWFDEEYRIVWREGDSNPLDGWNEKHGLDEIPIAVAISEGTDLFDKQEEKARPFLFKYLKAGLWNRETAVLTTLFTALHERGVGPLVAIKDGGGNDITVDWSGSVRYIIGDVTMLNDKAYDSDILQALDLLNNMAGETLIYRQAFGQPVGGQGTAYSTVALLNQAGRLPLVSPSEAVAKAIGDAMSIILRRIKKEGAKPHLESADVPENFDLSTRIEIKLPTDQLRNAQIAQTLTQNNMVSNEWVQTNILGINDPEEITKQAMKERYLGMRFEGMANQFMADIQAKLQAAAQAKNIPTTAPGNNMPPEEQVMPNEGEIPERGMMPGTDGGPQAAMAGAEQLPMTEPMIPPGMEG